MKFDIDEHHFTVSNLLLLLLAWANTCYILVILLQRFLPFMITTILVITGTILTLVMVGITIYITARWIKHHNLGWWALLALIVLIVISLGLETTIRSFLAREQVYNKQQLFYTRPKAAL